MYTKLEEKLIEYEKNTPVSTADQLAQAVKAIIDDELAKSDDMVDFDLVDEATEFYLSLCGEDIAELDSDAKRIGDAAIAKSREQTAGENQAAAKKKSAFRMKWIIPIAAVISIMAVVVASGFGFSSFDIMSMTKKDFERMEPKTEYSDGKHDIIITFDIRDYETMNELIGAEGVSGLLENDLFNDKERLDGVRYLDYGEYADILVFLKGSVSGDFEIITPSRYSNLPQPLEKVGSLEVRFSSYDDVFQAEWFHNGNSYRLTVNSKEALTNILEQFKESRVGS